MRWKATKKMALDHQICFLFGEEAASIDFASLREDEVACNCTAIVLRLVALASTAVCDIAYTLLVRLMNRNRRWNVVQRAPRVTIALVSLQMQNRGEKDKSLFL